MAVGLPRAGSTVAFALLSWTAAHELSMWLLEHAHVGDLGPNVWPWGHHAVNVAVILGCLAAGSLLALTTAPAPKESAKRPVPIAAVRSSALLATGGFVGTDIAGRAVAGDLTAPSLLVVLIGLGTYGFIGVAASLLWHCWFTTMPWSLARFLETGHPKAPQEHWIDGTPSDRPRPRHWARAVAGRSPPFAAA